MTPFTILSSFDTISLTKYSSVVLVCSEIGQPEKPHANKLKEDTNAVMV